MGLYKDIEKGLLEAVEIEKGKIPVVEKENMPALTFVAEDVNKKEPKINFFENGLPYLK